MSLTDPASDPFDYLGACEIEPNADGFYPAEASIIAISSIDEAAADLAEATEIACAVFGRPIKVETGADDRTWLVHLNQEEYDQLVSDGYLEPATETQHVMVEMP